jgi:drug/metabolite transporter (DMT)-like permease
MTNLPTTLQKDNVGRGIAFVLLAVLIFSTQDAATKYLVTHHVSPFLMTMMRFWAFAAFSLVLVMRAGPLRQAFRSKQPILQLLRGPLLVVDIWAFVLATNALHLDEVQAVVLVYPLLVTLMAIPILGEKVGLLRLGAVFVGFLGALLIVRPGGVPLDWGVGFAVLSGACYALYLVLTRKVSATDSTTTSMFYTGVVGLVVSSSVGIFFWQPLDTTSMLLIGYIMITGVAAHGLMIAALSMAPASVLQPFNYTSLPWSIAFSFFIFEHPSDPMTLLGAAIIIGAGLVVMARERNKNVASVAGPELPGKE